MDPKGSFNVGICCVKIVNLASEQKAGQSGNHLLCTLTSQVGGVLASNHWCGGGGGGLEARA